MKRKKRIIITTSIIVLIATCVFLFDAYINYPFEWLYQSSEAKNYFDELNKKDYRFKLISKKIACKIPYNFIHIAKQDAQYTYIGYKKEYETLRRQLNFINDAGYDFKTTSPIYKKKYCLLTFGSHKNKIVILYNHNKYIGYNGISLAISEDKGLTFKTYYTGLTNNFYYKFKENTTFPLFANDSVLQVPVDIVRETRPMTIPVDIGNRFEVLDSNLVISFNLKEIIKDSDHDNFTDLEERNMNLNPFNKDTDGDGLQDDIDTNPRFKSERKNFTPIYEAILEYKTLSAKGGIGEYEFILNKSSEPPVDPPNTPISRTMLIVTDDKTFQTICPSYTRVIILSNAEFMKYKLVNPWVNEDEEILIFKCDYWPTAYQLHISLFNGSYDYILKKTFYGWKLILKSATII